MKRMNGWMLLPLGILAACGAEYDEGAQYYEGSIPPASRDAHAGETYGELVENDWITTDSEAISTFSIDVDNGSYTLMRDDIRRGQLPAPDGVRVEEYLNYFDYDYPPPTGDDPVSISMEIAPSEFGADLHMLRVGLQSRDLPAADMRPANLVFLIDTSGSMSGEEKLPLVQKSLTTLVDNLRPSDTIGIVTYAGTAGVLLDPTPVSEAATIKAAIDSLAAGGSTNGEGGITSAYRLAESAFIEDGTNRVIIASDGDMNVGRTGQDLIDLIADYRDKHISLTTVGYGRGNYNDFTMEGLAREGHGNYFYIDSLAEAERIFGEDLASTLEILAADVKLQVEFATDTVVRYRLVGYENRLLDTQDFDDDAKDAGDIGPGHTVTALYELELAPDASSATGLLADVRFRFKRQFGTESELTEQSIKLSQVKASFAEASADFQFAAAVTEYAEILRQSKHSTGDRIDDVIAIATAHAGDDTQRLELVELATDAAELMR